MAFKIEIDDEDDEAKENWLNSGRLIKPLPNSQNSYYRALINSLLKIFGIYFGKKSST